MAPTVCEAEFPMTGTTINTYVYRRHRSQNGVKRRSFAREQMLLFRTRTINETPLTSRENCLEKVESTIPNCSTPERSSKLQMNMNEDYKRYIMAKKDLLSIVIRTIILVERNRILQKRVNALRAETRRFLHSVLNNPENQCHQQQEAQVSPHSEDEIVSSSCTEKVVSMSSPPLSPDSTGSFFHEITSTCDNCDHTNDESSSSDESGDSSRSEC